MSVPPRIGQRSITIGTTSGDDVVITGSGDDVISFVGGSDYFDAGDRQRHARFRFQRGGSIDLRLTTPQDVGFGGFGTFLNFENVTRERFGAPSGERTARTRWRVLAPYTGSAVTIPMLSMANRSLLCWSLR